MKFFDQVTIEVSSGKGGDGLVTGRREKGVPRGGPAGGNGGKGGSIIFVASKDVSTLLAYKYRKIFKAKPGGPGQSKDKYGSDAVDVELEVPIGTLIKDNTTGHILAHLMDDQQRYLCVPGGKGGIGNMHFAGPQNQYPQMALLGEPGQHKQIMLELQLLGDVALIGTPSVGKSSLINAISNVKAKTADYEFTTLVPNLGIVAWKQDSFIMVDVPGLIKDAHLGKGLGSAFLRHILKARAWIIMLDASKDIPGREERGMLLDEIHGYIEQRFLSSTEFGEEIAEVIQRIYQEAGILWYEVVGVQTTQERILLKKALITCVNKCDLLDEELRGEYRLYLLQHIQATLEKRFELKLNDTPLYPISVYTRNGIDSLLDTCREIFSKHDFVTLLDYEKQQLDTTAQSTEIKDISEEEKDFLLEEGYISPEQGKKCRIRSVRHPKIAYLCSVLPRGNTEAELWFWQTMEQAGHLSLLRSAGVKRGDIMKIITPYAKVAEKYVLRE